MSGADRLELKKAVDGNLQKSAAENAQILAEFQMLTQQLQQGAAEEEAQGVTNEEWMERLRKEGRGL
jgi:hypothetical protein